MREKKQARAKERGKETARLRWRDGELELMV